MLKPILESFEVKFMPGKHELTPHWKIELKKQSEAIKKYEYKKISIEGHTDATEEAPKQLSRLRAKAVYDEFVNNGIPKEKLSYVGLSSVLPAASNDSEAGKMANRRVVVVVE
jgi:outer membrane protein OmpA-like peptidoglycan-associated protein